jgi:MOSC domain-containing protein YiiM
LTNLATEGFEIQPGDLGENITTVGLNLHDMPVGTVLRIGEDTLLALTGLRNPCQQIEQFRTGLLKQCLPKDADGTTQRRAGVMSIVIHGGIVRCGDAIEISLPPLPHQPLQRI